MYKKYATKRRQRGGRRWKGAQCAPTNQQTGTGTCFTSEELEKLKQLWNARHLTSPITETSPKQIVRKFQKLFRACPSERCWLKKITNGGSKFQKVFAPLAPKTWKRKPNEWLTDEDIRQVMRQYEQKYPCFQFIGPSPIDFDTRQPDGKCVWADLCHFQFPKGKTKIGIIFNTDPHDKPGEHWISMFVHLKKKMIYFFDSTGEACPPAILALVRRIQHLSPGLVFRQNTKEHQFSSTECGMYSLYFIINMLRDKIDAEFLATHELKDAYIAKFREIYFDPID